MKKLLGPVAISAILCCSLAYKASAQDTLPHPVFQKFSDLKWEKTPDGVQDVAILHVNPVSKAMELIIRAPKNFHVPRHWHSANETLTIISGTFTMKHDGSDEKVALNTGSYSYLITHHPQPNPGIAKRQGIRALEPSEGCLLYPSPLFQPAFQPAATCQGRVQRARSGGLQGLGKVRVAEDGA